MLATISSAELTKWMAYYAVSPFGEDRADYRVAQLTALTANQARDPKTPSFSPADFMPYVQQQTKPSGKGLFKKIKAVLSG